MIYYTFYTNVQIPYHILLRENKKACPDFSRTGYSYFNFIFLPVKAYRTLRIVRLAIFTLSGNNVEVRAIR